jgi:hypothetical protein
MAQYFFDFRSAETFSTDKEGVELLDAEAAHGMALDALVDAARDAVMEGSTDQSFAGRGSQWDRTRARSHGRVQFQNFQKAMIPAS